MSSKDFGYEEREEGEITDEFEDIISSDEEFSMRQRIEELEAKNAELEKIENISGFYGSESYGFLKKESLHFQSDRYPLVSLNISDDEDYPEPPSRIQKCQKLLHYNSRRKTTDYSSNRHHRRKKSSSPPPAPPYRASDKLLLPIFREKATAYQSFHSSKKKRKVKKSKNFISSTHNARECHIGGSNEEKKYDTHNLDISDSYQNLKNSGSDRSFSLNRDELRVALARNSQRSEKNVSLKDRLIRKKENTDTLNEKSVVDSKQSVKRETKNNSDDNLEEQELRIIALRSAVIRKHLVRKKRNETAAYSPSDFDEIYANTNSSPPISHIDEIAPCNNMEISPVPSPMIINSDDDCIDTKPIDMDIANSSGSDSELYEKWNPIEQIPLPNSLTTEKKIYSPIPLRHNKTDGGRLLCGSKSSFISATNVGSEVEEEELALRTLLLAKMNLPKIQKNTKPVQVVSLHQDHDMTLEAETLRNFLINNMKEKMQSQSTASVLKQAVQRLTTKNSASGCNIKKIALTNVALGMINEKTITLPADSRPIEQTELRKPSLPVTKVIDGHCEQLTNSNLLTGVQYVQNEENCKVLEDNNLYSSNNKCKAYENNALVDSCTNFQTERDVLSGQSKMEVVLPCTQSTKDIIGDQTDSFLLDSVSLEKKSNFLNPESIKLQSNIISAYSMENKKFQLNRKTLSPNSSKSIESTKQSIGEKIINPSSVSNLNKFAPKTVPSCDEKKVEKQKKHNHSHLQSNIIVEQITQRPVPRIHRQQITTMQTKIVKPNKVINHQVSGTKRKVVDNIVNIQLPVKKTKVAEATTRLITSLEVPKVKKLVIQLGAYDSDSEYSAMSSDENNIEYSKNNFQKSMNRNTSMGHDYYDITSPISLPMDSPNETPTGTVSPINTRKQSSPRVQKSIVNNIFEHQLDKFLRTVRSKVTVGANKSVPVCESVDGTLRTPVAVRHLPETAQLEYRRLINRMKILERQKQARSLQVIVNTTNTSSEVNSNPVMAEANNKPLIRTGLEKKVSGKNIKTTFDKSLPQKHILLTHNALEEIASLSKPSFFKKSAHSPVKSVIPTSKRSKENLLILYENSYRRIGTTIISHLDKNIELVQVVKEAKMAKLNHEYRLRELKAEMIQVQRQIEQEQERIKKIYPEICTSHQMIESLRTRRMKINKAVTALGKSVVGSNYSIINDHRPIILEKTKKLSEEIKLVNNMKFIDMNEQKTSIFKNAQDTTFKCLNFGTTANVGNSLLQSDSVKCVNESKITVVPETTQNNQPKLGCNVVRNSLPKDETEKCVSKKGYKDFLETISVNNNDWRLFKTLGNDLSKEKSEERNCKAFMDYISPLSHQDERQRNPNGIICPYELMGQCHDKDCEYMHLEDEQHGC